MGAGATWTEQINCYLWDGKLVYPLQSPTPPSRRVGRGNIKLQVLLLGMGMHTGLPGTPLGASTRSIAQAVRLPSWPLKEITPDVCYDTQVQLLS
jgi:hypothetical protein